MIPFHPLSNVFPLMGNAELAELAADIKKNGQREAIVRFEDKILDGRNRYNACLKIGRKPLIVDYNGSDPVAFVISANVRRRHLTQAQKHELVASLLAMQPERTDRATAKLALVDHKTVGRKRAELEGRGEIPHVERRVDSKGRSVPAPTEREAVPSSPTRSRVDREAQREANTARSNERPIFVA
jgi:hypothetical protein